MIGFLSARLTGTSPRAMRHQWPWKRACVAIVMCVVMVYSGFVEGCPCDPIGASNSGDCEINSSFRCLCRHGYKGLNCSVCKEGYFRSLVLPKTQDQLNQTIASDATSSSTTGTCIECQCNEIGSLDLGCDSYGNCQCQTGVGGPKCDQCLVGYHSFTKRGCKQCDCMDIATKCHSAIMSSQTKAVQRMCNQCIQRTSWSYMCNQMCKPSQYLHQDGSCRSCQCKSTEDALSKLLDSRQCNIFTGQCLLLTPCSKKNRGTRSATNCSLQHYTESTTTSKNWEDKSIDSYLIAGAVSCFLMLILCVIIVIYIVRRKRRYRRTPMPLWTIELKREDTCRSSFTDYSDVDVMYLDDSYLMDSPSELFSASTDSINERIGGYHTLS
ncbi:uncharacterized protein [Amphiura filiformis]|uniref:uncharacterized protein n=1 Tax=Amphiura filiformis TaxID=82378 RepID=UPI003B21C971